MLKRLRDRSRAALARPGVSTGRALWEGAARGGAQAAGRDAGEIAPGRLADLVTVDAEAVDLADRKSDIALDTLIFAGDERLVRDVWSAGRHVVCDGRHVARDAVNDGYRRAMKRLRDAL